MKNRFKVIMLILISLMISFLSLCFSLRSICVNTISSSSINPTIANRVVDIVFDQFTGLSNSQLVAIQRDIINSKSLHHINSEYFDDAISYINDDQPIKDDKQDVNNFVNEVIDIIENNTNLTISKSDKQSLKDNIDNKISFDTVYLSVIKGIKINLSSLGRLLVSCFGVITSLWWQCLLLIVILVCVMYLFVRKYSLKQWLFNMSVVELMSGLINTIIIFLVQILSKVYNNRYIYDITSTDLNNFVILTIISLLIGILLISASYLIKTND